MGLERVAAGGTIALTGVALIGIAILELAAGVGPVVELVVGGFAAVIGLALVAAGVLVYRSDFGTRRALRVAGWNALGVVVIAAVLALIYGYQLGAGGRVVDPLFSGAVVVGVSAVAHVLIGYNDVRRIRAEELAREREKLAVVNRLVRHDLRNSAQLLLGLAGRLSTDADDPELAALADEIEDAARSLGSMNDKMKEIQRTMDPDLDLRTVEVAPVVDEVVADARDAHPGATIEADAPAGLSVRANEQLEVALRELVTNAIEHDDGNPEVRVSAAATDGRVAIRVADSAPEIPETERELVGGEREITPVEHGSGLGLRVVAWIVESYGGELAFDRRDGGNVVTLRLDRAE